MKKPIIGVKQVNRGKHKGKWRAICTGIDGIVHSGPVRETRLLAMLDANLAQQRENGRLYV